MLIRPRGGCGDMGCTGLGLQTDLGAVAVRCEAPRSHRQWAWTEGPGTRPPPSQRPARGVTRRWEGAGEEGLARERLRRVHSHRAVWQDKDGSATAAGRGPSGRRVGRRGWPLTWLWAGSAGSRVQPGLRRSWEAVTEVRGYASGREKNAQRWLARGDGGGPLPGEALGQPADRSRRPLPVAQRAAPKAAAPQKAHGPPRHTADGRPGARPGFTASAVAGLASTRPSASRLLRVLCVTTGLFTRVF